MWLTGFPDKHWQATSVALFSDEQLAAAAFELDARRQYNISHCNGATCDALTGAWVRQYNLSPAEQYWIVSSFAWSVSGSTRQRIWVAAQAFPEGALFSSSKAPAVCLNQQKSVGHVDGLELPSSRISMITCSIIQRT